MRPILTLAISALLGCHGKAPTPELVCGESDPAQVGQGILIECELEGAEGAVTWTISEGELPAGLSLVPDEDRFVFIEGAPTRAGLFEFGLTGLDEGGLQITSFMSIDVEALTALMSGYEPFGGNETNPSIDSLWPIDGQIVGGLDVTVVELPVVWDVAWDELLVEIEALDPDVIISTGQAGSDRMRFETNAVNVQEGTDNDDVVRSGEEVVEGGPDALPDRLPEEVMSAAMEDAGYATSISDSAGTYLCNDLFYHLMYHLEYEAERDDLVAGFIHVSPAGQYSSYSVEDITAAHIIGLEALSDWFGSGEPLMRPPRVDEREAPVYFDLERAR